MEKKTITQYYVEFYQYGASDSYIMQSRWFDTQEEAEQWYETSFDFINHGEIGADLMAAEWDDEEGCHQDIFVVKKF
jgi:hypothetical protein